MQFLIVSALQKPNNPTQRVPDNCPQPQTPMHEKSIMVYASVQYNPFPTYETSPVRVRQPQDLFCVCLLRLRQEPFAFSSYVFPRQYHDVSRQQTPQLLGNDLPGFWLRLLALLRSERGSSGSNSCCIQAWSGKVGFFVDGLNESLELAE